MQPQSHETFCTEKLTSKGISTNDIAISLGINYSLLKVGLTNISIPTHSLGLYNRAQSKIKKLNLDTPPDQLRLVSITIILYFQKIITKDNLLSLLGDKFIQHIALADTTLEHQLNSFSNQIISYHAEALGDLLYPRKSIEYDQLFTWLTTGSQWTNEGAKWMALRAQWVAEEAKTVLKTATEVSGERAVQTANILINFWNQHVATDNQLGTFVVPRENDQAPH